MVMPCSRSARRPSVTKERSTSLKPRRSDAVSIAATWSSKICRVSRRSLPMRVLLPSSTEPMVANLRRSIVSVTCSGLPAGGEPDRVVIGLEVALALAVLHGRFREAVVGASRTALGDVRHRRLADDLLGRRGRGAHDSGARRIPNRAEPHCFPAHLLAWLRG